MSCCPTCKQELPGEPGIGVYLTSNRAVAGGRSVMLTPDQAVILHALLSRWPTGVSKADIMDAVWGKGTRPTDPWGVMRTQIYRLKKRLKPLGYEVENVLSFGYLLVRTGAHQHPVNLSDNPATILRQ